MVDEQWMRSEVYQLAKSAAVLGRVNFKVSEDAPDRIQGIARLGLLYTVEASSRLLGELEPSEASVVIAHEIGHIKAGHLIWAIAFYFPEKLDICKESVHRKKCEQEHEADQHAVDLIGNCEQVIQTLIRVEELDPSRSHKNHPPLEQRLNRLRQYCANKIITSARHK